jgi:hypothetical protein
LYVQYIEEWQNDNWQGKTGFLREKFHPSSLPTIKYSWNTVGLTLGLNGKKPKLWYIPERVK